MDAIEPHWISLLWFAAFATVCTLSFLVIAGMFPLRSRPDSLKSNAGLVLVAGNAVLLAALSIGTALFGYSELRWSTLIVVAGLVVLFSPGIFEVWPSSFRDGGKGLVTLIGIQLLALATLAKNLS
jgi:predicted permease